MEDNPEGLRVGNSNFIVGKFVASGSFGKLHLGRNSESGVEVAIKLEPKNIERPQLLLEFAFYKQLGSHKGIPKMHKFGPCGIWNALVIDLLGPTLQKMLEKCDGKFGLKTTTQLAIQLLQLFEYFHRKGLIYRDTKPENFLLGLSNTELYNAVHITDFGLCKQYKDSNGIHIPMTEGKSIIGTARYMSINNHLGREQSRRDDLEAVGYMLVYLFKGELPWQGLNADSARKKYKMIGNYKRQIKTEVLCAEMPEEFYSYMNIVRSLEFEEEPKYRNMINKFLKLLAKSGFDPNDGFYDWDKNHNARSRNQRK